MTRFNISSTAAEVAIALSEHITGKNVIITGVTLGGLSAEVVRVIAKYAGLIVITGRSKTKLDDVIRSVKEETPSANLRPLVMDLSSLAAVREAAVEVNAYHEVFHVLINNAAIMAVPYSKTVDGFESHMGVNHFGHFLFTALIFSRIVASGTEADPARIVNISSAGHRRTDIRFDDMDFADGETYNKFLGYGQSKTANIMFSNEIARRARVRGVPVVAYSVHPGGIAGTGLGTHIPLEDMVKVGVKNEKGEWTVPMKSLACGAATYVVAAFDPSILPESGAYLADGDIHEDQRWPHAKSQESGEKLWDVSEKAVNEKFVI